MKNFNCCLLFTAIPLQSVAMRQKMTVVVSGQLSGLLSDEAVKKMKEANVASIVEDAQLTTLEAYFLFFNGWPCDISKQTVVKMNGYEYITTKHIQWLSRRWQIADSKETEQGKVL